MSVFTERPATALLVVDVQVDAMQGVWGRAEIIDRIAVLIEAARSKGVPVIWIRHSDEWLPHGSDEWQIVPELLPAQDEAIVEKCFGDSFEATDLEEVLGAGKVGHIVVCGAQSDACIISTLYGGFVRGYNVTLVRDAHTTPDRSERGGVHPKAVVQTVNRIWAGRSAPDRHARIMRSTALIEQNFAAGPPDP